MQKKFLRFKRRSAITRRKQIRKVKRASRHPFAVPVFTFLGLLLVTVGGYLLLSGGHPKASDPWVVIVSHDHVQQTVPSREPTVGALLKKLHINLHQGDVVEPTADTRINQDNFRINVYRAVPVEVVDGSTVTYTFSAATTPRSIARQTGSTLYPDDIVTTTPVKDFIKQGAIGEQVIINRAVPVNLNLYGTPISLRTHAKTVNQLIKEKNIKLASSDQVMPAADTPITPGEQIFIARNGTKLESQTLTVPMPVQYVPDSSLSSGTSAVRQAGSAGQQVVTYQVNLQNGKEIGRTVIQTVITVAPVTEIIAKGTQPVSGSLATWLYKLRTCESGGNYQENTGNGYYGAYQFSLGTWQRLGYSGLPSSAPPATQDAAIVTNTKRSSGGLATQNPGCYYKTGISAFPPGG